MALPGHAGLKVADFGTKAKLTACLDWNQVQEWTARLIREHEDNDPPLVDFSAQGKYSEKVLPRSGNSNPCI